MAKNPLRQLIHLTKKIFFNLVLRRNSPEWFIHDTCGIICAIITWLLILYGQYVVFYIIIPSWFLTDISRSSELDNFSNSAKLQNNLENLKNKQYLLLLEQRETIFNDRNAIISSPIVATFNAIIFLVLSIFAFISHCRAMFSDPGSTELNNASPDSIARMNLPSGYVLYKCTKCIAIKPERAHHCSICRRCINKMDHHCPWINNCVGEKNQKFFVLFTFYI